jgi:hypothetical protein
LVDCEGESLKQLKDSNKICVTSEHSIISM